LARETKLRALHRKLEETEYLLAYYIEGVKMLHEALGKPFLGSGKATARDVIELAIERIRISSGENDGQAVRKKLSTHGLHQLDQPKTQAGSFLLGRVPSEGSPGDAQER
jgi:hypothetical protein